MKTPALPLLCLSLLLPLGNAASAEAPPEPSTDPVRAGIERYLQKYLDGAYEKKLDF